MRHPEKVTIDFTITVARRRWYEWLSWLGWGIFLVFAVQNALASGAENEPEAQLVFWLTGAFVLAVGLIIHFLRRKQRSR